MPSGAGDGHLGEKLGPEGTLALLDAPALLADLAADLLARLLPEPRRAGCGEGLHLQGGVGVVQAHRDDALGLLLDLEAQVQALARKDLDAAEIDVGTDRIGLGLIERADRRAIGQRRPGGGRICAVGCGVGHARIPSFGLFRSRGVPREDSLTLVGGSAAPP